MYAVETQDFHRITDPKPNQHALLYHLSCKIHQSLDIEQVTRTALDEILIMSSAQHACLLVVDAVGEPVHWLTSDHTAALTDYQVLLAMRQGLQGQALRQHQILYLDDDQAIAPESALLSGRSFIIVPLYADDTPVGVLTLGYTSLALFRPYDESLLASAAEPVGQALGNALRYRQATASTSEEEAQYRLVHDIRSPLMAVSASLEVIKRALQIQPAHESVHTMIQESISSGQHSLEMVVDLTSDLLDIGRLRSNRCDLDYQAVRVDTLYREVHTILRDVAQAKHIALHSEVMQADVRVYGDLQLLRRMVTNLVANAIRYTPEDGEVRMTVRMQPEKRYVVLVIEDNGPGICKEDRDRIFRPFVQVGGQKQVGSGLGLTICSEIVQAHEGQIWVEDRPGGGSRFCAALPVDELLT